ncbi:carbohydrate-binding protein [Steroidobacter sp. S1-65]|uniref:Carbohydrate-binding protein n=1 Tax=Steroidobacter gossypii TaxID=2805490 RepID=A0ABS1WWN6_9GAMM|nr:carbohydrate-binding protein [Steroidobacter gossypii]MBM0105373.1 carbohydrate-binding protein [Steroidobacter gossypii]
MKHQGWMRGWLFVPLLLVATQAYSQAQMERLSRGVVAVRSGSSSVYVGWRLFGNDPAGIAFNLYRSTAGGSATLLNGTPITTSTNFVDNSAPTSQANTYFVRPVLNGVEQANSASFTLPANAATAQYLQIPLQVPAGGTTPSGESYTYTANDMSVGDLDGDGEYEYVLKWDPSNAKDNSQSGYTGNVYLDAYELNGTRLWRIDLGRNIRAGAHYTQFIVYDLDGDGRAEVAAKTADGTRSGTGQVIGSASADHRNSSGYILAGPEYLTIFNGQNGAILATTDYIPARGNVGSWGDTYGNRVDRFLAGVAYLDGQRPSLIMSRGYYTRAVIVAWDWRNGQLTQRWTFDSNASGNSAYAGQGNHNLSIADVDADGRQEVIFGAATIDDNGRGLYVSGLGHGDALHVGDFIPSRAGLEIWGIHESSSVPGADLRDARTGARIFAINNTSGSEGPGRGVAGDIYAGNAGAEFWGSGPGMTSLFNASGGSVGRTPSSANFLVWWDSDTVRELLDSNHIDKYGTSSDTRLLTGSGVTSNNGTKATPALSGDVLGDWREEVIWRTTDNAYLRIYTTTNVATNRLYTFLHDPQYRVALAWQNVAYNQPPHPSFFVGAGMSAPPTPNITIVGGGNPGTEHTYQAENGLVGGGTVTENTNAGYLGNAYVNSSANGGYLEIRDVDGRGGGSKTLAIRFALGVTSSRTGRLLVNGAAQNITFNPTGSWTAWSTLNVPVTLNNGSNVLRFESTGQDLGNIDQVTVQ